MKAVRLHAVGGPVVVEYIAPPRLRAGAALVRMEAAPVLAYMSKVISGELGYRMPAPPFTPGTAGVGVVEAVADDAVGIAPGMRVFIDPRFSAHANVAAPETILIGLTAMTERGDRLQAIWKDGSFAQMALEPVDCLTPLEGLGDVEGTRLCCLGKFPVAYGGLVRGRLRPGETLVVNGATGNLGSAAIPLGLAMGAARIVAVGRDEATLQHLVQVDPRRVVAVALRGERAVDAARIREAAGDGAHMALDLVGRAGDANGTLACLDALRPQGRLVLMGSMAVPLPLDYGAIMRRQIELLGASMYPRSAPGELAAMVRAGTLDLGAIQVKAYPLEQIDAALNAAASLRGLEYCVVTMC
jgi:alcohol dehydrogenase